MTQMFSQSLGQMLIDFKADNWLKNNLKSLLTMETEAAPPELYQFLSKYPPSGLGGVGGGISFCRGFSYINQPKPYTNQIRLLVSKYYLW